MKLEYRYEMRFNYDELHHILDCVRNEIDHLKGLFEDWYPLSDQEMAYYKMRADDLKKLTVLEKQIWSELNSK